MRRALISLLGVIPLVAASAALPSCKRPPSDFEQSPMVDANAGSVGTTGTTSSSDGDSQGEVVTTTLFRNIAKRQNPMVVAVTTQTHLGDQDQPFGSDDFFSRFFGSPQRRNEIRRALGSGFLVSPDGQILTNNHVVAGAEQIRVALFNNERKIYDADLIGSDPLTDTALIKLKNGPGNLPTAVLGDSDALDPGDWVMAIGNPFQLGHTVTVGVISFKGRSFATSEGRFQQMLQTDASINPGNSGGPLIDVHGQVVGINTAILAGENSGNLGIGFAVPINAVKKLLPQLSKGSVPRGELGVQILTAPITDEMAKQLGLPKAEGAIVSRVEPGSAAERAGLRAGDVIVNYNGTAISDAEQLTTLVVDTPPGTSVPIVLYRGGRQQRVTASIEKLELEKNDESNRPARQSGAAAMGLSLGNLTPDIAAHLQLPANTQGALIENVEPLTPAASAGLKRGDVILEVNRQAVHSGDEAARALRSLSGGSDVFLLINRQGVQQFVQLKKE